MEDKVLFYNKNEYGEITIYDDPEEVERIKEKIENGYKKRHRGLSSDGDSEV